MKKNIEYIGSGIGFRPELKSYIFLNRDKIDFLEIIADHYIDVPKWKMEELKLLKAHFVIIPHAINLSIGSIKGVDDNYLDKLNDLINFINPPYWSEHIAYTQAHDSDLGHLSPVVYNDQFLSILQQNIEKVMNKIKKPFILENITYHIELPGKTYSDADFLNKLCETAGVGLLLDLTNLYINSKNFGFDSFQIIDQIKPENIIKRISIVIPQFFFKNSINSHKWLLFLKSLSIFNTKTISTFQSIMSFLSFNKAGLSSIFEAPLTHSSLYIKSFQSPHSLFLFASINDFRRFSCKSNQNHSVNFSSVEALKYIAIFFIILILSNVFIGYSVMS